MKKTEVIKLADDKEYTMTTLNVGDLIEIEEKFGSITIDISKTKNIMHWLWASLKKQHKDMTIEELYELVDAPFIASNSMGKIFESMSRLNGWDKMSTDSKNESSPAEKK